MRQSLMWVVFAAALLFECYALSVALPMAKSEDGPMENDVFTSFLSDQASESGLGDGDLASVTKTRVPKLIVIAADPSLWRDLQVLHNGLPIYKRTADDSNQVQDHKDNGQQLSFPILRRDTMRCMVGRVYRPCWEV